MMCVRRGVPLAPLLWGARRRSRGRNSFDNRLFHEQGEQLCGIFPLGLVKINNNSCRGEVWNMPMLAVKGKKNPIKIAFHLMSHMPDGTVLTECSVETAKGVKVADVVWASDAFLQRNRGATPYIEAPEVCVEIQSPSNSDAEMAEKRSLYFARGTRECWLCDEDGNLSFFSRQGKWTARNSSRSWPTGLKRKRNRSESRLRCGVAARHSCASRHPGSPPPDRPLDFAPLRSG